MCNHHSNKDFVHLHLHTEYSLLDGFAQINRAVQHAADMNMDALAITDHGTMFGVIDFYEACRANDIKPIIGVESYLARRTMQDRDPQLDRSSYHLLLLARNETGYKNLLKIASAAQLEGFYYAPRIDRDFLARHAEGLIATSGCLAAEIPRMVEAGREDEARQTIGWYQDVFGKENFFLELQQHDIPKLERLNKWLIENHEYADVPLVATNDVHYVTVDDHDIHDTLLCIQTGETKHKTNRMRMTDPSYHLRSPQEMWRIFGDIVPEALYNTRRIAEMCNIHNLLPDEYHLPIFPVPDEFDGPEQYLRYLCERGVQWRYGADADTGPVQSRLNHELNIIFEMGFATYFLIVWDLVEYARHANIWWNVRGSGAGSLVAYALGITNLDPLENALIFERFLNPHRKTMPDFDLDFPEDHRQEMIEYCVSKYGSDKAAAIITFGTLKPKAAIRDVGRALEVPLPDVDRLAKLVPAVPKPPSIRQLLGQDDSKPEEANAELITLYENDPTAREVLDYAAGVEGAPRHAGTHAAGIIVADKPLVEYLPLHRPTGHNADEAPVGQVTQFPMETAERIGLLKIDFLGLSTLTIMRVACELIEKHHGIQYDMWNIPYKPDPNDPEVTRMVEETFEMLGRGETVGVFQLESSGMRQMLVGMQPQTFEHIIAAIALYRPGPMQFIPRFNRRLHGEEDVDYLHPKLEPIIGNTYGIITYQEQIMQIAVELFGYTAGEADLMRRAISKKKEKEMAEHRAKFMERGPAHGVDSETAKAIYDQIEYFANYGFNKSHAADYAVITCQTAFLKCHYPHEYLTALLSVYRSDTDKVGLVINDARSIGIDVLPVHINHSLVDFDIETTPDGERHIRFGMGAIKNLGVSACHHIIAARQAGGPFQNIDDFLERCSASDIGKRGLEALIKVGALDDFGDRPTLLHNLDKLMKHSTEHHKAAAVGQVSLFDVLGDNGVDDAGSVESAFQAPPKPADKREQLRWEKELVGMYLTDHPLKSIMGQLREITTHTSRDIHDSEGALSGRRVTIVGLVNDIRIITTKRGDAMAILQVEDIDGVIECVMFPDTWGTYRDLVEEDRILLVRGKADQRRNEMQIIVDDVAQDLAIARSADQPPVSSPTRSGYDDGPPPWLDDAPPPYVEDDDFYDEPDDFEPDDMARYDDNDDEPDDVPDDGPAPSSPAENDAPAPPPVVEEAPPAEDSLPPADAPPPNGQPSPPATERMVDASGRLVAPPAAGARPRTTAQRRKLIVTLKRNGDDEADYRLLRWVYSKAMSFPGTDELCVVAHSTERDETYTLDFPDLTTNICPPLLRELYERLGEESVQIVPA